MKPRRLRDIGREAHLINAANGWDVFFPRDWPVAGELAGVRFLGTHLALIHSEVSEAMEAVRYRDRANFDEELADVIIRVASIAHGLGTDANDCVVESRGFFNHAESCRTCVHGFTHYAILPRYLR